MNNFLAEQTNFLCNNSSIYKTKHNSVWSRALSMPLTIIMEFWLVMNLTMGGNRAVTWRPIVATRYVKFATTLNTR